MKRNGMVEYSDKACLVAARCERNKQIITQQIILIDKMRTKVRKELKYPDYPGEARIFIRALLKKVNKK